MGDNTKIEWTRGPNGEPGATWNPIRAKHKETGKKGWFCTKPSAGCKHCYAESMNVWRGNGLRYIPTNLDKLDIIIENVDQPIRWKRPRIIFVCSMTDLFGEFVTGQAPALGPVDWTGWEFVQQILAGGESGQSAQPAHPNWFRATRDFCRANQIAFHFKQWGEWLPLDHQNHADPTEKQEFIWPDGHLYEDGELSTPACAQVSRVGKKNAGRVLDGRTWDEIPIKTS
jgi:protein gp37